MLLSIITVNLNNGHGLRRTIKSVASQVESEFEFLVIDGGSTDESMEVLGEYNSSINYWISEKDAGIYEAMNKGIAKSRGDYCLFLNSGDWLVDSFAIRDGLRNVDGESDIYYSDLYFSDGSKSWEIAYPKTIRLEYLINNTISHQNALISRVLLLGMGGYREDFRIVSDWAFFLAALHQKNASFKFIPTHLSYCSHVGISNMSENDEKKRGEHEKAIFDIFGSLAPAIQELIDYRASVIGNIVNNFGYSTQLEFLLKVYRYFARRLPLLRCMNKRPLLSSRRP